MKNGRHQLLDYLLIGSAVLLISGCAVNHAQVPHATTYPATNQQIMQAGHHWDVLAGIESEKIMRSLPEGSTALVINKPTSNRSAFAEAYYDLLQSQLVKQGALVLNYDSSSASHLSYDIKILTHNDRGYTAPPMGTYSVAAGSVALLGYAFTQTHPGWVVVPFAVGADLFSGSAASPTPTEVFITTKLTKDGRFLMSDSRIYYINDGDTGNYRPQSASKTFQVVDN